MTRGQFCAALLIALAAVALPPEAVAHQQVPPPANSEVREGDVLVIGQRNPEDLPVKAESEAGLSGLGQVSRALGSAVAQFQRCAATPRASEWREILDHGPRDKGAQRALHRFIVRNQVCYVGYPWPPPPAPYFGDCNPQDYGRGPSRPPLQMGNGTNRRGGIPEANGANLVCRAFYDRGALFERAVKTFGEGIALTREVTFDPKTRARFMDRAKQRGKFSEPADRNYFIIVGCMVQISPAIARGLLKAERGSAEAMRARQYLIGYGEPCVGTGVTVKVDPDQFRAYAAEALYVWLAAAANKATLVTG